MNNNIKNRFLETMTTIRDLRGLIIFQSKEMTWAETIVLRQIQFISIKKPDAEVTVSDIIAYMKTTKSAVSQLLSSLDKKGYINRKISKYDRRLISLSLTEKGTIMLKNHKEEFNTIFDEMIEKIGVDDMNTLIELLNKMAFTLNEIKNEKNEKEETR
ncbi:MAG: winged helix DNA-binding protein [Clostridia bacterium]